MKTIAGRVYHKPIDPKILCPGVEIRHGQRVNYRNYSLRYIRIQFSIIAALSRPGRAAHVNHCAKTHAARFFAATPKPFEWKKIRGHRRRIIFFFSFTLIILVPAGQNATPFGNDFFFFVVRIDCLFFFFLCTGLIVRIFVAETDFAGRLECRAKRSDFHGTSRRLAFPTTTSQCILAPWIRHSVACHKAGQALFVSPFSAWLRRYYIVIISCLSREYNSNTVGYITKRQLVSAVVKQREYRYRSGRGFLHLRNAVFSESFFTNIITGFSTRKSNSVCKHVYGIALSIHTYGGKTDKLQSQLTVRYMRKGLNRNKKRACVIDVA